MIDFFLIDLLIWIACNPFIFRICHIKRIIWRFLAKLFLVIIFRKFGLKNFCSYEKNWTNDHQLKECRIMLHHEEQKMHFKIRAYYCSAQIHAYYFLRLHHERFGPWRSKKCITCVCQNFWHTRVLLAAPWRIACKPISIGI